MNVALPEQLIEGKSLPRSGNCKQQMTIAQPITGSYTLGSSFIINIPGCQTTFFNL